MGLGRRDMYLLCRAAEPLASFRFLVGREEEKGDHELTVFSNFNLIPVGGDYGLQYCVS